MFYGAVLYVQLLKKKNCVQLHNGTLFSNKFGVKVDTTSVTISFDQQRATRYLNSEWTKVVEQNLQRIRGGMKTR